MHAYIHTYIHTYMHTYIHTFMHACMHACIHAYIHTYIHNVNQIKTTNDAVGSLGFFFVNLVTWWNGHVFCFFNSLNKMTNAACENATRRCPRN